MLKYQLPLPQKKAVFRSKVVAFVMSNGGGHVVIERSPNERGLVCIKRRFGHTNIGRRPCVGQTDTHREKVM